MLKFVLVKVLLVARKYYWEFSGRLLWNWKKRSKIIKSWKEQELASLQGPQQLEVMDTISREILWFQLPKPAGLILIHWMLQIYRQENVAVPGWAKCQPPILSPASSRKEKQIGPLGATQCIGFVSKEGKIVTWIIIQMPDHTLIQEALQTAVC